MNGRDSCCKKNEQHSAAICPMQAKILRYSVPDVSKRNGIGLHIPELVTKVVDLFHHYNCYEQVILVSLLLFSVQSCPVLWDPSSVNGTFLFLLCPSILR